MLLSGSFRAQVASSYARRAVPIEDPSTETVFSSCGGGCIVSYRRTVDCSLPNGREKEIHP